MPNQHAVIVGGSSGIGLAAAQQLLAAGFKVTIAGRSQARLTAARESLKGDLATLTMISFLPWAAERAAARLTRSASPMFVWDSRRKSSRILPARRRREHILVKTAA